MYTVYCKLEIFAWIKVPPFRPPISDLMGKIFLSGDFLSRVNDYIAKRALDRAYTYDDLYPMGENLFR